MGMRLACQEQLLPGKDLVEKFAFARDAGYDGIELRARQRIGVEAHFVRGQSTRLPHVAPEFNAVGVVVGGSRSPEAAQREPRIVEIGRHRGREHCRRRDASHNFVS